MFFFRRKGTGEIDEDAPGKLAQPGKATSCFC